jgi:hypothetical protein
MSTLLEVEAPGAAQRSGQRAAEEDHRGERRQAWPTGEAAGCRPPPGTRPHLNDANPGVEVEGPRGVAVVAVRDVGGGVAAGATTAASATAAASSAVVVPPVPRLSQVVVVSH